MTERRPDWTSPAFWQWSIPACNASPTILARWFGENRATVENRKRIAAENHGITFPSLSRSNQLVYPDDPPPGWPEASAALTPMLKLLSRGRTLAEIEAAGYTL